MGGIVWITVGVILMIAAALVLVLVLPRFLPSPWRSNRPRSRSRQDAIDDHSLIVDGPPFYAGSTAARRNRAGRRSPQDRGMNRRPGRPVN